MSLKGRYYLLNVCLSYEASIIHKIDFLSHYKQKISTFFNRFLEVDLAKTYATIPCNDFVSCSKMRNKTKTCLAGADGIYATNKNRRYSCKYNGKDRFQTKAYKVVLVREKRIILSKR